MLANQIPAPASEVQAFTSAVADLLAALKSGANALQAAEAALPDLLQASNGLQNIGTDIQSAANQAYIGWGIAQVYEKP